MSLPVAGDWNWDVFKVALKPDHSSILLDWTWFVMEVVKIYIEVVSLRYCRNSKNTNRNMVSVEDIQADKKSLCSTGNVKYRAFCMLLSTSRMCGLCSHFRFTVLSESTVPRFCRFSFFPRTLTAISYSKIFLKCYFKAQTGDYVILPE